MKPNSQYDVEIAYFGKGRVSNPPHLLVTDYFLKFRLRFDY